jgi:hypothetical protein
MVIKLAAWKQYLWSIMVLGLVSVASCNSEDKKASVKQSPPALYTDYKITAEEGSENVIVLLQFREDGAEGNAIALGQGSKVTLDGEVIPADSARMAGVYYEVQRPLAGFAGKHKIVFTDDKGQLYEEEFEFNPVMLEGVSTEISRNDLALTLGKNAGNGKVQVSITDTSFTSEDINEEFPINNGQLHISKEALQNVTNGPIVLELHKEEEKKLANGRLLITYAIKRELELRD